MTGPIRLATICLAAALAAAAPAAAAPAAAAPVAAAPTAPHSPPALPVYTQIAAGRAHMCGLTSSGGVQCWGMNAYGQLGDGATVNRSTPADVTGLTSGVTALAAGDFHTCALVGASDVKCWGMNANGQLGDGTTTSHPTPASVVGLTGAMAALAGGAAHTCALTAAGGVKCWGANSSGQLGDDTFDQRTTPADVVNLPNARALSAGANHTCALTTTGAAKCWGDNRYGQLGDGTTTSRSDPGDVTGLPGGVAALGAGSSHTCAALASGGAKCWGDNAYGQLGDGTTDRSTIPVAVTGLAGAIAGLVGGEGFTCALTGAGGVLCWGRNSAGQLGNGATTRSPTPVNVTGLAGGVLALAAGAYHACALNGAGAVQCWGSNSEGALGDGTIVRRGIPSDVVGLAGGVTALAASDRHTCVSLAGGGTKCWGDNPYGALGDGTNTRRSTPSDVIGLPGVVTALAAGGQHTCAATNTGSARCWGANSSGQLGNGTTTPISTPVDVSGLASGVVALAAGSGHTCALASGGVKCWGGNAYGQLGNGTTTPISTPVEVSGLISGVTALAAGWYHTCAVTAASGVKCWGDNRYGQLGDGTTAQRSTPVDVSGLPGAVQGLTANGYHTCAVTAAGGVKCWGNNSSGQLGDGTNISHTLPADVVGLTSGVDAVAAGAYHTCARTSTGGVKCWGQNRYNQLGDGTSTQQRTPVDVAGLAGGAGALFSGWYHTCILTGDRRPKCWGMDGFGQLGRGALVERTTPVDVVAAIPAQLALNYRAGRPGSPFILSGDGFAPGSPMTVTVNQTVLTTTLPVYGTGNLIVFFDTTAADAGGYWITASTGQATAGALFIVDASRPGNPVEGQGASLVVPAGIAAPYHLYHLPFVAR